MAASGKVQLILTKYFIWINWEHYVIYLQNKKFVQLILWPGGAYTDDTYATKPELRSHIRIHFMNHDCIGSLCQSQMSQKCRDYLSRQVVFHFTFDVVLLKAQREMAKIVDFDENRRFWRKPQILTKTMDFDENCRFLWKPQILMITMDFDEKCNFQADLISETAKTTFPTQPSKGQHQTLRSIDFSVKWKTTCLRR